jgi:hypothetical protein
MKEKIIKRKGHVLKPFKSITMDDIASEMCISKKNYLQVFSNKELLVRESTAHIHKQLHETIDSV